MNKIKHSFKKTNIIPKIHICNFTKDNKIITKEKENNNNIIEKIQFEINNKNNYIEKIYRKPIINGKGFKYQYYFSNNPYSYANVCYITKITIKNKNIFYEYYNNIKIKQINRLKENYINDSNNESYKKDNLKNDKDIERNNTNSKRNSRISFSNLEERKKYLYNYNKNNVEKDLINNINNINKIIKIFKNGYYISKKIIRQKKEIIQIQNNKIDFGISNNQFSPNYAYLNYKKLCNKEKDSGPINNNKNSTKDEKLLFTHSSSMDIKKDKYNDSINNNKNSTKGEKLIFTHSSSMDVKKDKYNDSINNNKNSTKGEKFIFSHSSNAEAKDNNQEINKNNMNKFNAINNNENKYNDNFDSNEYLYNNNLLNENKKNKNLDENKYFKGIIYKNHLKYDTNKVNDDHEDKKNIKIDIKDNNYIIKRVKISKNNFFITKIRKIYTFKKPRNNFCYLSNERIIRIKIDNYMYIYNPKIKYFIFLLKLFIVKNIQEYIFNILKNNKIKYNNKNNFGFPFYIKTIQRIIKFFNKKDYSNKKVFLFFNEIFHNNNNNFRAVLNKLCFLTEKEKSQLINSNIYTGYEENELIYFLCDFSDFDKNLNNEEFITERLKQIKLNDTNIFTLVKLVDIEYRNLVKGMYCLKCFNNLNLCKCYEYKNYNCNNNYNKNQLGNEDIKDEEKSEEDGFESLDSKLNDDEDLFPKRKINYFTYNIHNEDKGNILIKTKSKLNKNKSQIITNIIIPIKENQNY